MSKQEKTLGKGEKTRQAILHKVAVLFNEKGYAATSMQDITAVTGIQRGGIYNHFVSKEALVLETFEYARSLLAKKLIRGVSRQKTAVGRLKAIALSFAELYTSNPIFPCGCQVLNAAVEAKRQMLPLRQKAQAAIGEFKDLIVKTTLQGIDCDELPEEINPDALAIVFVSTLEGAMLLSVLHDEPIYLQHAVNHLHEYIDSLKTTATSPSLSSKT